MRKPLLLAVTILSLGLSAAVSAQPIIHNCVPPPRDHLKKSVRIEILGTLQCDVFYGMDVGGTWYTFRMSRTMHRLAAPLVGKTVRVTGRLEEGNKVIVDDLSVATGEPQVKQTVQVEICGTYECLLIDAGTAPLSVNMVTVEDKVYTLDLSTAIVLPLSLERYTGRKVRITGTLQGETVLVNTIELLER